MKKYALKSDELSQLEINLIKLLKLDNKEIENIISKPSLFSSISALIKTNRSLSSFSMNMAFKITKKSK